MAESFLIQAKNKSVDAVYSAVAAKIQDTLVEINALKKAVSAQNPSFEQKELLRVLEFHESQQNQMITMLKLSLVHLTEELGSQPQACM